MVEYLVVLLDDTSVSYCHYPDEKVQHNLIPIDVLKQGIKYAMLENLTIQFVYPEYALPDEYNEVIATIDHCKIVPSTFEDKSMRDDADVVVFSDWIGIDEYHFIPGQSCILRTSKTDLFERCSFIESVLGKADRLNIVLMDVETFSKDDFDKYQKVLATLSQVIENMVVQGKFPQLNLLTDRMLLNEMNNCNAGVSNVTLAPDGNFYVCPAFYNLPVIDDSEKTLDDVCQKGFSIGSLQDGLNIKNFQLYLLNHAPICRNCDAYQCKRCIWLNRKTTNEVNTPSHEQCVVAHLERNASRELLLNIQKYRVFMPEKKIMEIDYLDPFDKLDK